MPAKTKSNDGPLNTGGDTTISAIEHNWLQTMMIAVPFANQILEMATRVTDHEKLLMGGLSRDTGQYIPGVLQNTSEMKDEQKRTTEEVASLRLETKTAINNLAKVVVILAVLILGGNGIMTIYGPAIKSFFGVP